MIEAVFHPYPQYLGHKELADPYCVINDFYCNHELHEARKFIADWITFGNKREIWDKTPANILLTFCEAINQLIEAAWVIQQSDTRDRLADVNFTEFTEEQLFKPDFYCNRHYKDDPWDDFPRSLKRKEYLNPYIVFDKIFKFRGLAQWKEHLYTMVHTAISEDTLHGEDIDILNVKEHLNKLIEATHLIHIREYEWVNHHLQPKTRLTTTNKRFTKQSPKE